MTFSEMVSSVFYNALGQMLAVMTIFLIVSIKRKISSWRYPVRTWTLDSLHEVSSGQSVREPPVPRRSFSSLVSNPWMKFASHVLFELLSLICLGFRSLFSFFCELPENWWFVINKNVLTKRQTGFTFLSHFLFVFAEGDISYKTYNTNDYLVRMRDSYKRFVKTWIRFANPWIRFVS
jgi:hypothetical protein